MTLPSTDTVVSYPSGAVSSTATVLHAASLGDGRLVLLLDTTACHPVDAAWPDQGADRATMGVVGSGAVVPIVDCVVGATDGETLYLGSDVPVRKGTEGWTFVVAHMVDESGAAAAGLVEGGSVAVEVDAEYRHALSIGHTACHLASLALNAELEPAWTKDAPADARGIPNFDALAIETSTITENGSVDVYRLGKSLRRKGFVADALIGALPEVTDGMMTRLGGWVSSDATAGIRADGELLTSRRYWECELDSIAISIPCGGTHATRLGQLGVVTVALETSEVTGGSEVRMTTRALPTDE